MNDQSSPIIVDENHAPKVLLMGEISSGKTRSIRTLIDAGVEVFLIATEPNYADILGDIPPDKLHWHYIPSYPDSMAQIRATATLLQTSDVETIKKMPGVQRSKYMQFINLIDCTNNYVDQRTGTVYGDVMKFTPKQALVIDGMSGINNMAKRIVAGDKPFLSWPEMEGGQNLIEGFFNTLIQGCACWFVLTAHLDWENNPVTGTKKLMVDSLGNKLAPRLPKFFSEAILCRRNLINDKLVWTWDNMTTDALVKFRNLAPSTSMIPDFAQIKANWEKKVEFSK